MSQPALGWFPDDVVGIELSEAVDQVAAQGDQPEEATGRTGDPPVAGEHPMGRTARRASKSGRRSGSGPTQTPAAGRSSRRRRRPPPGRTSLMSRPRTRPPPTSDCRRPTSSVSSRTGPRRHRRESRGADGDGSHRRVAIPDVAPVEADHAASVDIEPFGAGQLAPTARTTSPTPRCSRQRRALVTARYRADRRPGRLPLDELAGEPCLPRPIASARPASPPPTIRMRGGTASPARAWR